MVKFPDHVTTYIDTEMEHQAIYGPYTEPPYGDHTQIPPFMSREKADSENRRIIIDLSWIKGASINTSTPPNVHASQTTLGMSWDNKISLFLTMWMI